MSSGCGLHLDISCSGTEQLCTLHRNPFLLHLFPQAFRSCFSPIDYLKWAALLVGDNGHGSLLSGLCSSLHVQELLLQQSFLAKEFADAGHGFLLTSFTAFQLGLMGWHRVAVLGLSCQKESEVLAASPAWVPRLSAAGA